MKYERLTIANGYRVKEKYVCGLSDKNGYGIHFPETYNRLAELEDMIEDGRMLESPCKVGDEVYIVAKQGLDIYAVEKTVVCDLWFSAGDNCLYPIDKSGVPLRDMFTTRAEAEKKLAELKGE